MRLSKVALTTLAFLMVCTSSVAGLTGEDAIKKAFEAEDKLPGMLAEAYALVTAPSSESTSTTDDGITVNIKEHTDPETGESLKLMYDLVDKLVQMEYFDPVTRTALTTKYDENGNVASNTIITTSEDGTALMGITIAYQSGGCKTYTVIDYTASADNKVTTVVCNGEIVSQEIETEPGVITCLNTLQSEIDL